MTDRRFEEHSLDLVLFAFVDRPDERELEKVESSRSHCAVRLTVVDFIIFTS